MLLPSDRYIAELLGLTDEQYVYWKDEVRARQARQPQPAVVCVVVEAATLSAILINTAISVGFTLLSVLLTPTPRRPNPGRLNQRNVQGQSQTNTSAYAPRSGFDAVQDIASIGDPIPLVYANREVISGVAYGGVRVNTPLLWSQILSLGGSQMLRAILMVGEGEIAEIDPAAFAIGNNPISAYDFTVDTANQAASRLAIYFRPNGGRIRSADRIAGRSAAGDIGNAENDGADDVYMVRNAAGAYAADFSASSKPSTATSFGLYAPIGHNLGYKLNPSARPMYGARIKPRGSKGNGDLVCDIDRVVETQRKKFNAFFSTRSGVISGSFGLGDTFAYRLDSSSDFETQFFSGGGAVAQWTASFGVEVTANWTNNVVWASRLDLSVVTAAPSGEAFQLTATLDVADIVSDVSGMPDGLYDGLYIVRIKDANDPDGLEFESEVYVTISISGGVATVDMEVDEYSGPVVALTSPDRLQSAIVYPYNDIGVYSEAAGDAASAIAGWQKSWDDAIAVGELYKFGSALAVCTARAPDDEVFASDSEDQSAGSGQSIEATFRVVRAGTASTVSLADVLLKDGLDDIERETATSGPHLARVALGNFATTGECRIVELGIRSTLGSAIGGLMNFRDVLTLDDIDGRACLYREGDNIKRGTALNLDIYQSGGISLDIERYSFMRVSYRKAGSSDPYAELAPCFGFRGTGRQASFSSLRFVMPSTAKWEFRLEPLSGWEIRSGTAAGDLVVVDAKMEQVVSGASGGVGWSCNGLTRGRSRSRFLVDATKRNGGMGYELVDENNYLDAWGKLAESFVYTEVRSSADQGPEHEIVYVNEIRPNLTPPTYEGIAILGVNARSAVEWSQFSQFSAYAIGGAKARRVLNGLSKDRTHLFPDIALDRLTNEKHGPGGVTDDLIGLDSFAASATWCQDRRYFYDGPVAIGVESARAWIADVAPTFLLVAREVNGKFSLKPAITFDPVQHAALFTAGNIKPGTFQYESSGLEERQRIQVSAQWRQERPASDPLAPGLFPEVREVLVREAGANGDETDPTESVNLSEFCTNEAHAIDVAKFMIRMRRIRGERGHTIRFETTYDGVEGISAGIGPGDMIRVALDTTTYDEFNNGAVLGNGTIVSTKPLVAGSYSVIAWDGSEAPATDQTLTVLANGTATPAGVIFTMKDVVQQVKSYEILSITPTPDGTYGIEAAYMPTSADGRLVAAADWDEPAAWVIRR